MRILFLAWAFVLGVGIGATEAAETLVTPPLEVVRRDVDLEIAADGRSWQSAVVTYRPLTAQGVEAIRNFQFSFTPGYENLTVDGAFTLKKDGTRIPVPQSGILYGRGASSSPGYADNRTISIYFSNVEIGDQITIATTHEQSVPWFAGVFAGNFQFSRVLVIRQASISLTAPSAMALTIDANGLEAGAVETLGGKTKRVWHYHNDIALKSEPDAVDDGDILPHLNISTLVDYGAAAKLHGDLYRDRAAVTPAITDLARQLTAGIAGRREQAKALYDWVSTHVKYVNLVLGAGGFTPHKADDVLHNLYGDCKDHVILLQALLSAKGIKSSAVLIRAGANQYKLPKTASPFLFDHLITYIPEFQLFADSTAQYAPFGILPTQDAGKTVLIVESGKLAQTPTVRNDSLRAQTTLTVNADGSADGHSEVTSSGQESVGLRAVMAERSPDGDNDYFRAAFGTGSSGKFITPATDLLTEEYSLSADYHIAHFAIIPGPGAMGPTLGYKPFSFTGMLGGDLPETRDLDYVCPSLMAEEDVTLTLPPGVSLISSPPAANIVADQAELHASYEQPNSKTLHEIVKLTLNHPAATCSPAYFANVRDAIVRMQTALKAQYLYK